jgi:hypothetical protein
MESQNYQYLLDTLSTQNGVRKHLHSLSVSKSSIEIWVFSDEKPEVTKAFYLWQQVCVDEYKYNAQYITNVANFGALPKAKGGLVFMALLNGECIGTIYTLPEVFGTTKFSFGQYLKDKMPIEVSKFVIAKAYRKSALKVHLMKQTQDYNKLIYRNYYIVHYSNTLLLPFYHTMYFFKVKEQREHHPEIGPAYMLACPCNQFDKVCSELLKITQGNFPLKVKWALRYWWYKRVSAFLPL